MTSIEIRDLDDDATARLRLRAAGNGRSIDEEARQVLRDAVARNSRGTGPENLASAIRARFAPLGGIDLETPAREPPRFE